MPAFSPVASRFSNCESFEYEVIAAGASTDLAYIVGVEHTTGGEWKVVHRHADPLPESESARALLGRLGDQ